MSPPIQSSEQGAFVSNMESGMTDEDGRMARPKAMIKPLVIMALAVALVLGGIFAWQRFTGAMMKKYMGGAATAPQTVSTLVAAKMSWQARTQALGSLRAVRGADLAAQASGVVDQIRFESGNEVPAGAVLLKLRPNDDPSKLEQLQAAAVLAEQTYKRDQEQFAAQAISQATLDTDLSTLKSARAQVAAQQALIEEKIVKAPFAGKLGIRQIDEGQYLSAGTTVVTLQSLDPIFIDFYVPQQTLANLQAGQAVTAMVDTYPGARFAGTVASINSKVDLASRNVQVRGSFRNPDRRLLPGMYANVDIDIGTPTEQLTLPQTAITYNPYGDTVFLVQQSGVDDKGKPKLTVQQRFVQLGLTRGDQVAVLSGISAGDVVVTAGQMKLRNGSLVVVNNSVTPPNDPSPSPPNE
jgi:membrane fusion protein (multidrug efflux system)